MILDYNEYQVNKLDANSGEQIMNKEFAGFVNTDCSIVKNILLGIMRITVKEDIIFNNEDRVKLNKLYNSAIYGN